MVVLGLGSNVGDRRDHLARALHALRQKNIVQQMYVSSVYESEALLPPSAPVDWNHPYLNLAIKAQTSLEPQALLRAIKSIEQSIGRKSSTQKWAPRPMDIDILAWEQRIIQENDLCIPHVELLKRPFALWPLAEIHPGWRYPVPGQHFQKTAQELSHPWDVQPPFQTRFTTPLSTPDVQPIWVGILNITPDSFSDGGKYLDPQHALGQARQLVQDGATVLDLGAESMRPGAEPLEPLEEWERLNPVLELLKHEFHNFTVGPIISVDTRHAEVAQRVCKMGVHWINDVSGFDDPAMREVVARHAVDIVFMHHLGTPPRKEVTLPVNQDPVTQLMNWAQRRIHELEKDGVSRRRMIFDPGIGFGKTAEQSLCLIRKCHRFHELGVRLLVGHSRKSFMNLFTDKPFAERDVETSLISTHLAHQQAQYIRVHNVASNVRALAIAQALQE